MTTDSWVEPYREELERRESQMKDEDWVDSIRPKQHTTTFTDSIYEGMSDESLLEMKKKVNAEWDRRQQERFAMLLKVRKQLHSHMISHGIVSKELQDD